MIGAKMLTCVWVASAHLALCASTVPALADDRLISHAYSESQVVRIDGKAGVQATIAFGKGEAIENVAVGDSQAWQITPNKRADLLFVKPLDATARTNMTVVTNRHTYFFDLVASERARPVYMLRFTYAEEPGAGLKDAGLDPAEQALMAGDVPATRADPATLNFAWKQEGVAKLMPARVYDDGNSTYLLWPEKASVPAILILNEKGEEGPVNYAVRGTTIVLDDVPETIVLRSGKAKATLVNTYPLASRSAFAPENPVAPARAQTGTISGSATTPVVATPQDH